MHLIPKMFVEIRHVVHQDEHLEVGPKHGVLFVIFCFCLLHVWNERGWSIKKVAVVFICSLLPFAPFYLERKLKQEELSSSGEG